MSIKRFIYPLKGNNDVASLRTKETALEAFLNSLSLSDDPDDPSHNHDSVYAEIAHIHPGDSHVHEQYLVASQGSSPPVDPDVGDIWIEDTGVVEDVSVWTSDGWVSLMGGGGGGGGPHQRHPDEITIYETSSDLDKWEIAYNPALSSLDFNWIG